MNLDVDYLIDFFNKNSDPNFEKKIDGELGEQEAAAASTGGGGGNEGQFSGNFVRSGA